MDTFLNRNFKLRGDINCLFTPGLTTNIEHIENIEVQLWHKSPMLVAFLGKGITNPDGEFIIEFEIDSPVDYIVDGKIENVFLEAYYNGELLNPPSYDEDALLYFEQLNPQPSPYFKSEVNKFIHQLKADNNWQYLDRLWIHASEHLQNANISVKNPSSTAITPITSPTWVAKVGYTGNGSSYCLDTHFIASASGQLYSLNNASFGIYQTANIAGSGGVALGAAPSGVVAYLQVRNPGDMAGVRINTTSNQALGTCTDSRGFFSGTRTASNLTTMYKNGTSLGTTSTTSVAVPTTSFQIFSNGAGGNFYNGTIAVTYFGTSAITQSTLYSAIQAFATAIGFNV